MEKKLKYYHQSKKIYKPMKEKLGSKGIGPHMCPHGFDVEKTIIINEKKRIGLHKKQGVLI